MKPVDYGLRVGGAVLAGVLCAFGAVAGWAQGFSSNDVEFTRLAFEQVEAGNWNDALALADAADDPLIEKLVHWRVLYRAGSARPFEDVVGFIDRNPDWPALERLRWQAELSMPASLSHGAVRDWFARFPPLSGTGKIRLAKALLVSGQTDAAYAMIREAWISHDFGESREQNILEIYGDVVTEADQIERLNLLLSDENHESAGRQIELVDAEYAALARARLVLMRRQSGVDTAIGNVPDELIDDPGLIYERARWRRREGLYDDARKLLLAAPLEFSAPAKWWPEQRLLLRNALGRGYISDAYRLAAGHRQTAPVGRSEGEWLAGWIALRYLDDPAQALAHFETMYDVVGYPISIARAAYWAGRAAMAAGQVPEAEVWYGRAAAFPNVYYGQLAAAEIGMRTLEIPGDPEPDDEAVAVFEGLEIVRVTRLLGQLREPALMWQLVRHAASLMATPEQHALLARLGLEYGYPNVSIAAAKASVRVGIYLYDSAYPAPFTPLSTAGDPEAALVLALARQESEMNPAAESHAGALGLMQLMPRTARGVAGELELEYDRARLQSDPEYNLQLGSAYLAGLLEQFDGSYAMALAGYNAGPHRVTTWVTRYGDPRDPDIDPIDWIEQIPFEETRNYVQRVLEATHVYRHHLAADGPRPELRPMEDITGGVGKLAGN